MWKRYDYYRNDRVYATFNKGEVYNVPGTFGTGINWKGETVAYVTHDDTSGNDYDCQTGKVYENSDPDMLDHDGNKVPLGATIFEEEFESYGWACGPFFIDESIVDDERHTVIDLLEKSYVGEYFKALGEDEYLDQQGRLSGNGSSGAWR